MMIKLSKLILSAIFLVMLSSCSGIKMLGSGHDSNLYSEKFLKKISLIKEKYQQGRKNEALENLNSLDDLQLLPGERALKRNLIGVIYFSQEQYEQAIAQFNLGLQNSRLDQALTAQIYLNISSCYFKIGNSAKALANLNLGNPEYLSKHERKNYFKLKYSLANELGREEDQVHALISFLLDLEDLAEIKNEPYFDKLTRLLASYEYKERASLLQEYHSKNKLVVGYLNYLESEKFYLRGEKEKAESLLEWTKDSYSKWPTLTKLVDDFFKRIENRIQVDPSAIGVILPMSGKKAQFGKRALMSLDLAFKEFTTNGTDELKQGMKNIRLIVKDSKGSNAVGSHYVKELIENDHVSLIIGGLFPQEASGEYLEAKKYGVPFISLSQIFLPKEQKDYLLIEIPGSVESQVDRLFNEDFLNKLGRKAAILYPESERGRSYISEFWRKAKLNNVEVTDALSFKEKTTDYRDQVKNILGLKFQRQRAEEYELLKEIHSLESKKSIRRLQTLKPQIDFDWVFVPSYPHEALQIIPSFNYFDAFNLNIIGSPSWKSHKLSRESGKLGRILFVGDQARELENFSNKFYGSYNKRPSVIELRSYDAYGIASKILFEQDFTTRESLLNTISAKDEFQGITGIWKKKDGIWIKDLQVFRLENGRFGKESLVVEKTEEASSEEAVTVEQ